MGENTANGYFYKPGYGSGGKTEYDLYNNALDATDAFLASLAILVGGVTEDDLSFSDVTTADTSITKHGLCPKLSGDPDQFLDGEGVFSPVTETGLSLSNITTANATTARHGFCPILPNDPTQYLNGQGVFTTVTSGAAAGYIATSFSSQTSVTVIHNLMGAPNVQVLDSLGYIFIPEEIHHNTINDFTVTFSEAMSGVIICTLGSPGTPNIASVATNYTLTTGDFVVVAIDAITLTLPAAAANAGRRYILKRNTTAGDVTVVDIGGAYIDGDTSVLIRANYSSMQVVSDGTGWLIL